LRGVPPWLRSNAGYAPLSTPPSDVVVGESERDDERPASDLETHGVLTCTPAIGSPRVDTIGQADRLRSWLCRTTGTPPNDRVVEDAPSAGWLFSSILAARHTPSSGHEQFLQSSTITEAPVRELARRSSHSVPCHPMSETSTWFQPARNVRPSMWRRELGGRTSTRCRSCSMRGPKCGNAGQDRIATLRLGGTGRRVVRGHGTVIFV